MALLVVAALDIGVPGHALTDVHEHTTEAQKVWCGGGIAATTDQSSSPHDAAFHHDDCFGCCANVLPEHVLRLLASSVGVPCAIERPPGTRPPLTRRIYHPPNG